MVCLLLLEQRPRAVAGDVTHCLRRKLVPSSTAEIHAGLSASWIEGPGYIGWKGAVQYEIHTVAES